MIDVHVNPFYNASIPQTQCGATEGKGTDLACHVLRSAFDYARIKGLSVASVFVDLSKAFDYALREIVLGWPRNSSSSYVDLLVELGLSRDKAKQIAKDIDEGKFVLSNIGVHPHIIDLLSSLHTQSWFSFAATSRS